MAEFAIALGAVALAVIAIVGYDALRRPGDERDPEQPHRVEKVRAQSEAEAAGAVSEVDEEAAAPLLAYVEEIGSGEFPALAFDADPLTEPIPDNHPYALPAEYHDVWAERLSAFAWRPAATPPVPLSSVQVLEPEPFEPESFTRGWTREQLAEILAEGKAASR